VRPYYHDECAGIEIILGDCLDVLPVECDAVVTDPPYNIGKAAWDKIPDYLEWCESWIAAASKGCKRQGAFWCFHSEPDVLVDLSRMIAKHGRPRRNWVTWDKYNENGTHSMKGFLDGYTLVGGLRRYQDFAEYIVYHADDGQWTSQSRLLRDECRGFIFEPLRAYICGEFGRAGMLNTKGKIAANVACGFSASSGGMASRHYFSKSQWELPTPEHYAKLRALLNGQGGDYLRREYDDLRREYDDLRREYEHLRPTFNNPGKVSSVWQYPPAPANGHDTPKPVGLMRRIVETTTNPGDVVLDCFMGSGTTLCAAKELGRRAVGIELCEKYAEIAANRLEQAVLNFGGAVEHNAE
jgi:adenine-specific DNA-methyltransferase